MNTNPIAQLVRTIVRESVRSTMATLVPADRNEVRSLYRSYRTVAGMNVTDSRAWARTDAENRVR